ncbi:MAG: CRISPR-associated RAMP protein, Cmr4 family [Candidatus Magnetoglobus multicellularis str. Araruama]|uniref:CRISPR-associated RAMP protein, Cmr4 family n=1 Tax=Candidatus Magnetoglobus multicellularis str. Araruama TaxID=890399 RepID=A0A1V1P732_9BACT|nr:MAG: CRISPR-associated RAMP protein, Cmr4 family [Candidatus Magnetoglobus multicellularis str. Araruama]
MYKQKDILVFHVESSLHAGSGANIGHIDNPIQREISTQTPIIQANGVKGALREFYEKNFSSDQETKIKAVFGGEDGNDGAGAVAFGEARLLFLPVRSLTDIFAYVTCPTVIARFQRDLIALGKSPLRMEDQSLWTPFINDNNFQAHTSKIKTLPQETLVLEEFPFEKDNDNVDSFIEKLAELLFPTTEEYKPFKTDFVKRTVILNDEDYYYFAKYATEVEPHNRIDEKTGTVDETTGVWYTEYLPSESILYTCLFMGQPHIQQNDFSDFNDVDKVKNYIHKLDQQRTWLGGDRTTGKGRVMMHIMKNNPQNKEGQQ